MSWIRHRLLIGLMLAGCAGAGNEGPTQRSPDDAPVPDPKTGCVTPSTAEQFYGINLHRLPLTYDSDRDPYNGDDPAVVSYKSKILGLEARWVRALYWNPDGSLFRERFVADLSWARSQGMRVLMTFGDNAIPNGNGMPAYDADDAAWATYQAELLAELNVAISDFGQQIDAWQILNEPNQGEDRGRMPPARFGQLTQAAARLLRQRVPQAQIVTAGLVNWADGEHDANGPRYLERTLQAVGQLPVDVLAFHAYGTLAPADGGPAHGDLFALDNMPRRFQAQVDAWQPGRFNTATEEVKLWVTEFGGPLDAGEQNGTEAAETYRSEVLRIGFDTWRANADRGVEQAFYFVMTDFSGYPGENLGLLTRELDFKAAYHTFDDLTTEDIACALPGLPVPNADDGGAGGQGGGDGQGGAGAQGGDGGQGGAGAQGGGGGQGGGGPMPTDDGTCDDFGGCGDQSCFEGRCVEPGTEGGAGGAGGGGPMPTDDGTCDDFGGCGPRSCFEGRCVDPGEEGGAGGAGGDGPQPTDDGTCDDFGGCGPRSCFEGRCVDPGDEGGAGGAGGDGPMPTDDGTCDDFGGCGPRSCVMGRCVDPGDEGGAGGAGGAPEPSDDGTCDDFGGCGPRSCVMGRCVDPGGEPPADARRITVRAAAVGAVQMELQIWGNAVHTWDVEGGARRDFSFEHNQDVELRSIKLLLRGDMGEATDLIVESVSVGGRTARTTDAQVIASGTWRADQCAPPGNYQVDTLHCDGGYFDFINR